MHKVGVDTGGTFTDFAWVEDGQLRAVKVTSTPRDPAAAVLQGLRDAGLLADKIDLVHGSTVGTNALLERRGGRVAFLTTKRFEDVLDIGRQSRASLYDLAPARPEPLVPREMRYGVAERMEASGAAGEKLAAEEIERAVAWAYERKAEAIAIGLLHSYANPEHERALAEAIAERVGVPTSLSHEILPEMREYERFSTTVANAFVQPLMARYLDRIGQEALGRLRVMQSNGGAISFALAAAEPVRTVLSGPAGGAIGAWEWARLAGYDKILTFDMGGTSTDVALVKDGVALSQDLEIGGVCIRSPALDIHTVGAGGGSVAYADPGGALKVGPRSAGAAPGPICYGRGGSEVTVTDANFFLGRLVQEYFPLGEAGLQPVGREMQQLGKGLRMNSERAAEGVIEVVNQTMARALRKVSVERGEDPREYALVAFGGAAGLHACDLARELGIAEVLIPPSPGTFSAFGMLLADVVRHYGETVLHKIEPDGIEAFEPVFSALEERAAETLAAEGFRASKIKMTRSLDIRYRGQSFTLNVPAAAGFRDLFHKAHRAAYGHSNPEAPVEVVTARVEARGITDRPNFEKQPLRRRRSENAEVGRRSLRLQGKEAPVPIYERARLEPGNSVAGPALVVEYGATTLVPA
ncbi:MAG: hydantoinase/oxoprolinase family protein, partial [Candidatus Methylomirabilis sp.]|nr:hydantoinase/oxoprolinase family protein [Deltaproteobacteria bacterium]